MTNTELLNELIERSGYKRSYIANQLGLSPYGLSKKIHNVTEFKASEINALCTILNIEDAGEKE